MRYEFTLTGKSALLMHYDDVEFADEVGAWRHNANNKKKKGEQSGDDRRPAWTWVGYCYHDGTNLAMPSANLTACLKKAGARVPLSGNKTFKEIAVSGVLFPDEFLAFANDGKPVPAAPILALLTVADFKTHAATAQRLGFRLFVKRASVGAAKHVRVRPRFEAWSVRGTLEVTDDRLTAEALDSIFAEAGKVGLGDWRPGSPKSPGPFGMFRHTLKPAK